MKQGKALKENPQIAKWYEKELQKLLKDMFDATNSSIKPDFKKYIKGDVSATAITAQLAMLTDTFYDYFRKNGRRLAREFLDKQLRHSRLNVKQALEPIANRDLGFMLTGSIITPRNRNIVEMAIYNNVSLIRSIPEQYFKDITGAVARSMENNGSLKQLEEFLMHYEGVTKRRAKLIATDQTRKVHSSLALEQMKEAGFTKVKWVHSNAGKVPRCLHIRKWDGQSEPPNGLNGYIFDIDNPPVIQKAKGSQEEVRGYPAQLINCRCFLVPITE